jgi:hypothetical protein
MRYALVVLTVLASLGVDPAAARAQAPAPAAAAPFPYLLLTREEVRAGKAAAHASNETLWSAAMLKGQSPVRWLGMSSLLGPSEAWFFSGYASYADWAKADASLETMAALKAENDRFAGVDADLLSRTTNLLLRYRGGLSYQPEVSLPAMRFMSVDIIRVKPGYLPQFRAAWRMQVAAHTTAKMNEHWTTYEVVGGGADGTFFFLYPMTALEDQDRSGPMHGDAAFGTAVGEEGRAQMRELDREAILSSETRLFQLSPAMSVLPPTWSQTDAFWAAKPPPPSPATPARRPGQQQR